MITWEGKSLDQNAILAQPLYADGNEFLWSAFPGVGKTTHGRNVAAGIYLWLLQQEEAKLKRGGKLRETWYELRHRLMKKVEEKIEERDRDDLITLLTV